MRILAVAIASGLFSVRAAADSIGLGLGPILGEPTGVTVVVRPDPRFFAQAHVGWSVGQRRFHLSSDALVRLLAVPTDDATGFSYPIDLGVGVRTRLGGPGQSPSDSSASLGLRLPVVGICVVPNQRYFEVFFEIAPVVVVAPSSQFGVDAVLGGRVFF